MKEEISQCSCSDVSLKPSLQHKKNFCWQLCKRVGNTCLQTTMRSVVFDTEDDLEEEEEEEM